MEEASFSVTKTSSRDRGGCSGTVILVTVLPFRLD